MKTTIKPIMAVVAMAITFALGACTGCKSLAPEGVYAGDTLLYNAESTVTTAYVVFDTFVKWEYDNRATLEKADVKTAAAIKESADVVRKNAPVFIGSTIAAIELYKKLPTEENRRSLVNALTTLQQEVSKAANYIKEAKQ